MSAPNWRFLARAWLGLATMLVAVSPAAARDEAMVRLLSVGLGDESTGDADSPLPVRLEVVAGDDVLSGEVTLASGLLAARHLNCVARVPVDVAARERQQLTVVLPCMGASTNGLRWSLRARDGRVLASGSRELQGRDEWQRASSVHFSDRPGERRRLPVASVPNSLPAFVGIDRVRIAAADFVALGDAQRGALLAATRAGALLVLTPPGPGGLPAELAESLFAPAAEVWVGGEDGELRESRYGLGLLRWARLPTEAWALTHCPHPLRAQVGSDPVIEARTLAAETPLRYLAFPRDALSAWELEGRLRSHRGWFRSAIVAALASGLLLVGLLVGIRRRGRARLGLTLLAPWIAAPALWAGLHLVDGLPPSRHQAQVDFISADGSALGRWNRAVDARATVTRRARLPVRSAGSLLLTASPGRLSGGETLAVDAWRSVPPWASTARVAAWSPSDAQPIAEVEWSMGSEGPTGVLRARRDTSRTFLFLPGAFHGPLIVVRHELGPLKEGQELALTGRPPPQPAVSGWKDTVEAISLSETARLPPSFSAPLLVAELPTEADGGHALHHVMQALELPLGSEEQIRWRHAGGVLLEVGSDDEGEFLRVGAPPAVARRVAAAGHTRLRLPISERAAGSADGSVRLESERSGWAVLMIRNDGQTWRGRKRWLSPDDRDEGPHVLIAWEDGNESP